MGFFIPPSDHTGHDPTHTQTYSQLPTAPALILPYLHTPTPENTHLLRKGKYHCTAHLQLFDWFGFGRTSKSVVDYS